MARKSKKKRKNPSAPPAQGKLANMYRQLESVVVAFADMTTCRDYCEVFVEENIASGSRRLRASCITAIMSTYARPFVETKQPDYLPLSIGKKWLGLGTDEHLQLHDEIIDLRHRFLAHSSRDVRQPNKLEGTYVVYNKIISADRIPVVREMADRLATQLELRRLYLHREVIGTANPSPVFVGHSEAGAPIRVDGDVFGQTITFGMTLPTRP
jgi:hypothetical protein